MWIPHSQKNQFVKHPFKDRKPREVQSVAECSHAPTARYKQRPSLSLSWVSRGVPFDAPSCFLSESTESERFWFGQCVQRANQCFTEIRNIFGNDEFLENSSPQAKNISPIKTQFVNVSDYISVSFSSRWSRHSFDPFFDVFSRFKVGTFEYNYAKPLVRVLRSRGHRDVLSGSEFQPLDIRRVRIRISNHNICGSTAL